MIDMLPDNVLLDIFDFYREDPAGAIYIGWTYAWRWKALIHVCRRWRCVIFGSPRRLDLRLVCTDRTPTRTSLDIWPPFPIAITCRFMVGKKSVENVMAAVEHGHDRISHIAINDINSSALEKLAAAMQQPLPTLKSFFFGPSGESESVPVLPETFLGGSAPLLEMNGIRHSIPDVPPIYLVFHSHPISFHFRYPAFRVHFTQCDGRLPRCVAQSRSSCNWIPIPSISPSTNHTASSHPHCTPHSYWSFFLGR